MKLNKFFYSIPLLVGTIVGVGLFGLPYVAAQTGFLSMTVSFLIIGVIVLLIHLMYGEVVGQEKEARQFPGYIEIYLGKKWKFFAFVVSIVGLYGALLAYIIIGGEFLFGLLSPHLGGSDIVYTLLYFGLGAALIYFGVSSVRQAELVMLIIFFAVVIGFFVFGLPEVSTVNLATMNFSKIFSAYGVIIFSLWGASIMPEITELFKKDIDKKKQIFKTVIISLIISVITYLIFIFTVTGISGVQTSKDAISGLEPILGNKIIVVGYIFGLLTTFTSYLTLGVVLKRVFWYDYKINHAMSWAIAVFVPLVLFFLGLNNFLEVVSLTGAVALGLTGVLIAVMYLKLKKSVNKLSFCLPKSLIYVLIVLMVLGIVLEIVFN